MRLTVLTLMLMLPMLAQNGRKLYDSYGCYQCHGREAQGGLPTGPRLGPRPVPYMAFEQYTRRPTGQMPPYTVKVLPDKDLAEIYAFVQSVKRPPAQIPLLSNQSNQGQ